MSHGEIMGRVAPEIGRASWAFIANVELVERTAAIGKPRKVFDRRVYIIGPRFEHEIKVRPRAQVLHSAAA